MTDRREPTASEVVTAARAQLDQAFAELERVYDHIDEVDDEPGSTFAAARSASIVAGITGQVADQLRSLAARQTSVVV